VGGRWILAVRDRTTPISPFHCALAAQVQLEFELVTVALARQLRELTCLDRLVLGGGSFLNSVANSRIAREAGFREVYTFPAAADDGTSVGAAYYALSQRAQETIRPRHPSLRTAALGKAYSPDVIRTALDELCVNYDDVGDELAATRFAARELANGHIIGWFQGRSEFGPRALGHRSIL